jgi:hypothetical protein
MLIPVSCLIVSSEGPALDTDESFSLIGEGRMNGHHNGNGYKGWARRQARRRNGHG